MPTQTAAILIVDDNANNLELLKTVLESDGFSVHLAQSGQAALRAVATMPFDLALIDVRMPQMTGYELCERLKAWHRTRDMPVIFLSALGDVSNKVQAFESGGDDYVVKPFNVTEVLARVKSRLRTANAQRVMSAKNEELRKHNMELMRKQCNETQTMTAGGTEVSLLGPDERDGLFHGKYILGELIGRGGFGEVYRATHAVIGRPVAIKMLRRGVVVTSSNAARFRIEGMSACRVDHPNAVAIWDAGVTAQGVLFLVMELLTGRPVRSELTQKRTISALRSVQIARVICDVLRAAHQVDVVHRDIKPDNIFLHIPKDSSEVVKVLDFGIAKLLNQVGINDGTLGPMAGTPEYLAPERLLSRPYDGRSDIYGLGCTMYELIAGRVPFVSNREMPWLVTAQHVEQPPVPLGDIVANVPPIVATLVHLALTKNPDQRPTAAVFLQEIDKVLALLGEDIYAVSSTKNDEAVSS